MPTGNPSLMPHGMFIAGCPVTSNGLVFGSISKPRWHHSASGALFGGSGVGKSTLLGAMARQSAVDVTVIALVGERNREVRSFLEHELGPEGRKRAVVVCATAACGGVHHRRAASADRVVRSHRGGYGGTAMQVLDEGQAAQVRAVCELIVPGCARTGAEVYVDALLARMPAAPIPH